MQLHGRCSYWTVNWKTIPCFRAATGLRSTPRGGGARWGPPSRPSLSHHRCEGLRDGRAGAADPGEAGWCPPHPENLPAVPAEPSPASLTCPQEAPGHPEDTPSRQTRLTEGARVLGVMGPGRGPWVPGKAICLCWGRYPPPVRPVLGRAQPRTHHLHAFHQWQPHRLVPAQRHHAGRGLGGGLEEGDHGLHPHAAGLVMTSRWLELAPGRPGDQPGAHRGSPRSDGTSPVLSSSVLKAPSLLLHRVPVSYSEPFPITSNHLQRDQLC